ncbi:ABC transporter transmembrane domain-containing protein [Peribacillus frigoritolerans]|uniref:ABC transporter transmembrane domain-containing protein n=1 Tax=Peribacillus frigoritolerans TaxID=450367 RepID=UPI0039C90CF4
MSEAKKQKGWRQFIRLVQQTKPSKLMIGIALALSLGTTGVALLVPLFTKNLINDFSVSSLNAERITLLVSAIIVQALASGFSIYLLNRIGQSVVAGIRDQLWKKLLVLPVSYFDDHPSGETVSRMTNDTTVVKGLISEHLSNFVTGIISIVGSMIVLFVLDWKMTLLMFTAIPLSVLILMPLGKKMHKISKGMQDETASFTAVLQQVLTEIRLVKASNAETLEYQNGQKGIQKLFQFGLKEAKIQALIAPLMSFVMMALLVLILGYGGMRVSSGALTAGALVAFIMYLFQIIMPMAQLASFFTQFQKATGATERIISILDSVEEEDAKQPVQNMSQSISVDHLNYSYNNGGQVLKDISFNVEAGKVTAIVGPSGSGKTTLFSLFERFYKPQEGSISIGGTSIDDFTLLSWRSQIGYVSQASDGMQALKVMEKVKIDLAVIDIMMPNMDGWQLCKELREFSDIPILMLTAKGETTQKVKGFGLGADDYLVKPFEPIELVLRIKALLKRYKITISQTLNIVELKMNRNTHEMSFKEQEYTIPLKEFELLFKLASYPGKTFSREDLIEDIWGYDYEGDERTVDVHIKRVRERFPESEFPFRIKTIWGLGYRLEITR